MKKISLLLFCFAFSFLTAQVNRIEPPNWWTGLKNEQLQLLVHHPTIGKAKVSIAYEGLSITKVHQAKSPNYLFIDLTISQATKPGKFNIVFEFEKGKKITHSYELKPKSKPSDEFLGFDSSDAIYLITPDRFANGNPSNDIVKSMKETSLDRTHDYKRHGGDIQGITNKIEYIKNLGFTAIWPTPVLTNDMKSGSYHGYAITDLYQVDPRFGTLTDYKQLAEKLNQNNMKLIMDQVANHCGSEHWWMNDLPFPDWVNYQELYEKEGKYITSNHRRTSNQDNYAAKIDKEQMTNGWFVETMPDLNQRNPFMAQYLIQNSIWWIETLHLGGIRQDTYPYPDKEFMSNWAGAIMTEYPNFSIVGEEWSYNPLLVGYWQRGATNKDGYESHLRSTMDFPMQSLIVKGIKEPETWDTGLVRVYEGLANDFYYPSPKDILIFPDNHDMDRIFTQMNENIVNTKMALATYLVLPRIPQLYYGTEILMQNTAKPNDHGLIRTDYPGGWENDKVNAFTGEGLTSDQKSMQAFLTKILNYRKNSKAIHEGKTIHFAPNKGVYVLVRMQKEEVVVLILNKNDSVTLQLSTYAELGLSTKKFRNVLTDEEFIWDKEIKLNKKGAYLFTTKLK
ncbi:glycoside hydrolase family 13 protein [Flavobacterium sp.]|uniref:glycoside hydrolase family 13 protein n=1 Tax=Flavobacterium sp. TaxID=239 RepID=UPI0026280FA5|nr:glycoside hydrolase family 13 protein [Flavobacterium sp.]MDD2985075.1 glycoside hydrolase family 13 protein [Flavobacterium sp.]